MSDRAIFQIGQKIERWTIIGAPTAEQGREKRWLCRCKCGTERYVLERSLKYGSSYSCGCSRKENTFKPYAQNMIGQTFGELTVLHQAEKQSKDGRKWWTCSCTCGKECDVPATLLVRGRKSHCGCRTQKDYYFVDITGKRFERLTALYPLRGQSGKGGMIWHCRCECGREIDFSYNELMYTNLKSCGCRKKEHAGKLKDYLVHVAGTSLDAIKSQKLPINNTSGAKGVYFIRGKWIAKIVFQRKAYYLGSFTDFEEAVRSRKEAEEVINNGTVKHYERWKEKADIDPEWGIENPIKIQIEKSVNNEILITFLPKM